MPSAAILMGGEARRFGGRDKSGLMIDGRSILERQLDELSTIADDILIVVACDMPFVTARFLDYLRSLTADADAVVPRTERGYHPVCAAYTQACRPVIETSLAEHRLSMREWL